jgi:DNA-binding response OmpR family regulator
MLIRIQKHKSNSPPLLTGRTLDRWTGNHPMASARISIVTNDLRTAGLYHDILNQAGYSVESVCVAGKALQILPTSHCDLLILDLPESRGFETLQYLRSSFPQAKILFVSGFTETTALRAVELVGASATLHRAEALQRLAAAVGSLLE